MPLQGAVAQNSSSDVVVRTRNSVNCKAGIFLLHDFDYSATPEDRRIITENIAASEEGNKIRVKLCAEYNENYISKEYKKAIASLISSANRCADNITKAAQGRNWQVEYHLNTEENSVLRDIQQIIDVAEASYLASNATSEAAEKTYDAVSNTIGVLDGIKETQLLYNSGKGFARLLEEQTNSATNGQIKDFIIERSKPWNLAGDFVSKVSAHIFKDQLSYIMSFSNSVCQ